MALGDQLAERDRTAIARAAAGAGAQTGLTFSVCITETPEGDVRSYARAEHARLADAASSVLVVVDPVARAFEIVTGAEAARSVDDRTATLAGLAMTSKFSVGDLTGGIVDGLQMLGEHGRQPRVLHRDQP